MIPLLALVAAGLFQSPAPRHPPEHRARANIASYLSDADYPADAIRAGEQGTVGFELDIGADGTVTGCRVVASSHSVSLDETTCRLMLARARFTPARDRNGRPTTDQVKARIRWVLPAEEPEAPATNEVDLTSYVSAADYPTEAIRQRAEGSTGVELSVSPDGRVARCEITRPSGSALLDARSCEIVRARARFIPARDAAGQPLPDVVEGVVHWTLAAP